MSCATTSTSCCTSISYPTDEISIAVHMCQPCMSTLLLTREHIVDAESADGLFLLLLCDCELCIVTGKAGLHDQLTLLIAHCWAVCPVSRMLRECAHPCSKAKPELRKCDQNLPAPHAGAAPRGRSKDQAAVPVVVDFVRAPPHGGTRVRAKSMTMCAVTGVCDM